MHDLNTKSVLRASYENARREWETLGEFCQKTWMGFGEFLSERQFHALRASREDWDQ